MEKRSLMVIQPPLLNNCHQLLTMMFVGNLESLKNVKKDVTEMRKGSECGIGFEGWNNFKVGDQIQCYEIKEEKRYL